ncbi:ABC transporter ATP-binding protein [Deminuibacter soli]|uniref:ABC transporter ATP-binding protein n=1 Tax=Deminuibacter soli TaxID=2291815 RepID=A0A3E1NFB7_9BACT|nr:ABC transporter ATP-binding protein [Deminuibacter soli]RFM26501.1 ABC transporter ATP-binding protein [Deminuibacter soli]
MQPVIAINDLCKQFGHVQAVSHLSFTVQPGDVYGFLGQNGAGKSTTIRMLLTLIAPDSGDITLFGLPLRSRRKEILRQVGAVIEKPDVYPYLSAYDNLRLFARLKQAHTGKQQLLQQLELLGLAERAFDKVKTFSQGMKQRLGIAIALINDPQLIILDEPTNGLDPQGIADIRNLVLWLSRERGKTILVSSHLLSEIQQVATRLVIIDKGRRLLEGETAQLFNPAETIVELQTGNNERTLQLLAQSEWQQGLQPARQTSVVLKMHSNDIPALNKWLVANGVAVNLLQPRHSLEDYFLQITSGKQHVDDFTGRTV